MVTISATLNCNIDTNSNVFEIQDFTFEFKSMLQLFKTEGNLAYEYNRADFDTGEALDKHIIKSAVTTDVFDNTNNEAGKFAR